MSPVRVRTRMVGCYFATVGQLVARNGRIVGETRLVPYGFDGAACELALELAAIRGLTVKARHTNAINERSHSR